jgi:hypothetical protein
MEFEEVAQIKPPKTITAEFVPSIDVQVSKVEKKITDYEAVKQEKTGEKIAVDAKMVEGIVHFMVLSNDKLKETRWYRSGEPGKRVRPFFRPLPKPKQPTVDPILTVVPPTPTPQPTLPLVTEPTEEKPKDGMEIVPPEIKTDFSDFPDDFFDDFDFPDDDVDMKNIVSPTVDQDVEIVKLWGYEFYRGPAYYFPVVTKISNGPGKFPTYVTQRIVHELPVGAKLKCKMKADDIKDFKEGTFYSLKGIYCERTPSKTEEVKLAQKRELEAVKAQTGKKQKTSETDRVNVVSTPGPAFWHNFKFQHPDRMDIPLQSEEERNQRNRSLLIQHVTGEQARVLDMLCAEADSKLDEKLYPVLGLDSFGFSDSKFITLPSPLIYFTSPAQNFCLKPNFYVPPKVNGQDQTLNSTSNDSGIVIVGGEEDGDTNSGDYKSKEIDLQKVDTVPTMATLLGATNSFPISVIDGSFTYKDKRTSEMKPKFAFKLCKKEPFEHIIEIDKTKKTKGPARTTYSFVYHDLSLAVFGMDINKVFGVFGNNWTNMAQFWVPTILGLGLVTKIEKPTPVSVKRDTIRYDTHPLASLFTDKNPTVKETTGQMLFEQVRLVKVYSLLEKSLQEWSIHFPYGKHMNRFLALLCDYRIVLSAKDKVLASKPIQKMLFIRNLAKDNGMTFEPNVKDHLVGNIVNPMNTDPEYGVVNHTESPKIIVWDGSRSACAVPFPELDPTDNTWKQNGTFGKMLDTKVCDDISFRNILIMNLVQTVIDGKMSTTVAEKNKVIDGPRLSYYTDLLLYMTLVGRVVGKLESITNSGDMVIEYHKFLENIDRELLVLYGLDKDTAFMSAHVFPSSVVLQSTLRSLGKFSLELFSIAAKKRDTTPKPSEEIIAIVEDTEMMREDTKKSLSDTGKGDAMDEEDSEESSAGSHSSEGEEEK